MKIEVIPYLAFNGNCEEALNTYIQAFGGEILFLSRWTEDNFDVSPDQIGKIMHVEFTLGNTRMSGGDAFDCPNGNTSIRLMVHMETKEAALRVVSMLSQGGTVLAPLRPHPEPDDDGCGSVTKDRFGFTWIVTCPNPDKQLGHEIAV